MTLRPDEDYIDTFERAWAIGRGVFAFVPPWLVVLTYDGNDGRAAWEERVVWLVWILGALLGVACVVVGRRIRRIGRIGTAIMVGDSLGALLYFVSLVGLFLVGGASG